MLLRVLTVLPRGVTWWPRARSPRNPRSNITYYLNCTWYTTGPASSLSDPGSQLRTCSVL